MNYGLPCILCTASLYPPPFFPDVSDKSKIYDQQLTHFGQNPIIFSCTGSRQNILLYIYSLPEQILSKIQSNPDTAPPSLTPMEVCTEIPCYVVFQCTATVDILPSSIYHHKLGCTSSGPIHYNIINVMTQRWIMNRWTENEPHGNTIYACLQHKNQTEGSSIYLYSSITIHNIYCCNFYLILSHYFNHAVLIYKVSVTKSQSAASFGMFVFKLPYICNSINQRYSSRLNIWGGGERERE